MSALTSDLDTAEAGISASTGAEWMNRSQKGFGFGQSYQSRAMIIDKKKLRRLFGSYANDCYPGGLARIILTLVNKMREGVKQLQTAWLLS